MGNIVENELLSLERREFRRREKKFIRKKLINVMGSARKVEVKSLEVHVALIRVSKKDVHKGEACIDGRFFAP